MARQQVVRITVPDDFEDPDRLVRDAMERYLSWQDRWRLVLVDAESTVQENVPDPMDNYR